MKKLVVLLSLLLVALGASSYIVTPSTVLVDTSADLQAAVDAMAAVAPGGTIRLGPGTFTMSARLDLPKPLTTAYPVSIIGSGNYSTTLDFSGLSADSDLVRINSGSVQLENVRIVGRGVSGAGKGLVMTRGPQASGNSYDLIKNVQVYNCPSWALYVCGTDETAGAPYFGGVNYPPFRWAVEDCGFDLCQNTSTGTVYIGKGTVLGRISNTHIDVSGKGVYMNGVDAITVSDCAIEGNGSAVKEGTHLLNTRNVTLRNNWYEINKTSSEDTTRYKILVEPVAFPQFGNVGVAIENCWFVTGYSHLKAIKVVGTAGSSTDNGVRITNCWGVIDSTTYAEKNSIQVGSGATKVILAGGGVRNQAAIPVVSSWGANGSLTVTN